MATDIAPRDRATSAAKPDIDYHEAEGLADARAARERRQRCAASG